MSGHVGRLTLALALAGCGHRLPHSVPRTLQGNTAKSAFVPPYAYEAYVRGELALANGDWARAVAQLELAAAAPDEDAYLLSRLAFAQLQSGDRASAAESLQHASALDRCSEAVWLMRGTLAESTQELAIARAAYEKATACAPDSPRGELALSQLLMRQDEPAAALDVLVAAAERAGGRRPEAHAALEAQLAHAAPATLAHALESLGTQRAADSWALEQAIRLALDRGLPRLALRLSEQHAAHMPPSLEARLCAENALPERLAALLASHDSEAFGGQQATAELALQAHAYERAELEASSALSRTPSDALHALHARALVALGRPRAALQDVEAVGEPALRNALLAETLAATGAPALAKELQR